MKSSHEIILMKKKNTFSSSSIKKIVASILDCKTVGFFLKISKEIGKAWRKSLAREARKPQTPIGRVRREKKRMIFTVFQKLIDRTIKLFVSIYSTKKYFTMFDIQSLALYEQKQQEQNIPT